MEDLNVSLEPHLLNTLKPVLPVLDTSLRRRLASYINSTDARTIPYTLLLDVSKWTRSNPTALRASSLNPNDYTMVALLAGATTSPERKFGTYVPPKSEDVLAAERKRERKAITTIVNGVFSVGGAGAAAWIGSANTGWKYEWVSVVWSGRLCRMSLMTIAGVVFILRCSCCCNLRTCAIYSMAKSFITGRTQETTRIYSFKEG